MALRFVVMKGSTTGMNLVRAYQEIGGFTRASEWDNPRGIVCYGAPYRGSLPALNKNAGSFDKFHELERLRAARVLTVPFSRTGEGLSFPLLGRLLHHTKGKDIIPILGPQELSWARRMRDFFTQYIPLQREFRVWCFRGYNIGTYEKVFKYPEKYKQFGCNNNNGFAFEHREFSRETLDLATAALRALELDFGAVDILEGQDGQFYVLEVNTAPGTEQGVLARLARRIKEWENQGCPARGEIIGGRRKCPICKKFSCFCEARRGRRAFACCGKRRCECQRQIR